MSSMCIEVKTQFEGMHCWPEAPPAVAFLRHMHRHMFHVTVRIPVMHGDRDLEFVMVKRALDSFIHDEYGTHSTGAHVLGRLSCENVACDIIRWIRTTYGRSGATVGVFEDGENGCWVEDDAKAVDGE